MWPRLGDNETQKLENAKTILEKFCPIATEYWKARAIEEEEKRILKAKNRIKCLQDM